MIRVRQVRISIEKDFDEIFKKRIARKLEIHPSELIDVFIHKKSLDARKKNDLCYSYEFDVNVLKEKEEEILNKCSSNDIGLTPNETYQFVPSGTNIMKHRPIIVGSGPSGLFAAFLLCEQGFSPIILERGDCLEKRIQKVEDYFANGIIDESTNVQFGEGGAGTFSDGKLNTLTKDKKNRIKKVFETFVACGANPEIMYMNHPHIGTDHIRNVIQSMREKIIEMGGEFRFHTCLTDIKTDENQLTAIEINHTEWILCDVLLLAIGHSARDTYEMLYQHNLEMAAKPFAVGLRIQHPQKMINKQQYLVEQHSILPNADYKLTYTTKDGRGVYTFCMCPGGFVVNASNEKNRLAINGMSNYERDSENANSAIVVSVTPNDFGTNPMDGIKFQRDIEEKAYKIGNSNIPIQLWDDFYHNRSSNKFGLVKPVFKGNVQFANLNDLFPTYISDAIKEAMPFFERNIAGFSRNDAILAGVESRSSSPLRILRDEFFHSSISGIYPIGEGSGYSGGITTSAVDGILASEQIGSQFKA